MLAARWKKWMLNASGAGNHRSAVEVYSAALKGIHDDDLKRLMALHWTAGGATERKRLEYIVVQTVKRIVSREMDAVGLKNQAASCRSVTTLVDASFAVRYAAAASLYASTSVPAAIEARCAVDAATAAATALADSAAAARYAVADARYASDKAIADSGRHSAVASVAASTAATHAAAAATSHPSIAIEIVDEALRIDKLTAAPA